MPTATRPHLTMKPSLSYNTISPHIKLAPTIDSATVISFEKRTDQKIWYILKIQPQMQPYDNNQSYIIARKYEDFAQLSQSLHDRFNSKHRAGSRLPTKIKSRLNILPTSKQLHFQRAEEINLFLSVLFQNQSIITESYIVLEFFGVQKSDMVFETNEQEKQQQSRWKRLRCSSFLARSPQSSLSSLSQAANKIIPSWHRSNGSPQPSISTPIHSATITTTTRPYRNTKQELKKSKSTVHIHPLSETPNNNTLVPPPPPSSPTLQQCTIKIKVIYDVDNIIVIQVPRTISLVDLRSRISQKFSDPSGIEIPNNVVLLYNDSMSSCCSVRSQHMALPAVLINKEQDLTQVMHTKWNRLEKVTLRCIM